MDEVKILRYLLVVRTGLRIGGIGEYEIGGVDNVVIKTPSNYPYVPGSSIKGKIRSLIEKKENKIGKNGDVHSCDEESCLICKTFGNTKGRGAAIFRDAYIIKKGQYPQKEQEIKNQLPPTIEPLYLQEDDDPTKFIEIKMETKIDRETGKAAERSLRSSERVKPGTVFLVEILVPENDPSVEKLIQEGIELLNKDYLGGCGTRGYGSVVLIPVNKDGNGQSNNI